MNINKKKLEVFWLYVYEAQAFMCFLAAGISLGARDNLMAAILMLGGIFALGGYVIQMQILRTQFDMVVLPFYFRWLPKKVKDQVLVKEAVLV